MLITNTSKFDQQRFYLLIHKIKQTKHLYDDTITSNEHEYLKGRRWEDDERIAAMILGDIYRECNFDYEKTNLKFLSLNSTEIEPYIKSSVLESASCDYYYTYEKDWG